VLLLRRSLLPVLLLVGSTAAAQDGSRSQGLARAGLAGQQVAVLPLTFLVRDSSAGDSLLRADRAGLLLRADSALGEALVVFAPEVQWILPAELRRIARRNPGILPDPDRMGHAVMRSPRLASVPDPTRAHLRALVGFTDGRLVFMPAALALGRDAGGRIAATLDVVIADARTGQVGFRTRLSGSGTTLEDAVSAAVRLLLPPEEPPPQ
jgi:hypothetical protein